MNVLQVYTETGDESLATFMVRYNSLPYRHVLELGTRQWSPGNSTHHKSLLAHHNAYVMADFMDGDDVDVVADAHALDEVFPDGHFTAFFAASVWEHLKRPWIAAEQVMKVIAHGGIFFIQTHQSFPLHGYPDDYWRFTRESLELIFEDCGAVDIVSSYQYSATLTPLDKSVDWNQYAPVFLNVCVTGRKQ